MGRCDDPDVPFGRVAARGFRSVRGGPFIHLPALPVAEYIQFKRLGDDEFSVRQLARDGARSNEILVEWLGSPARCSKINIGELVIHQQDVRRPLGLARVLPDRRLSLLLSFCLTRFGSSQVGGRPRDRVEGLRLVATDLDWAAGQGPEVRGPGEAIVMTITGRGGAIDDLSGPGVEVLASRGAKHSNT